MGINFERTARPKDQERNYIQEEIEAYDSSDYLDDFYGSMVESDKLSESLLRPVSFYDDNNRLDIKEEINNVRAMSPGPEKDAAFSGLKENFLWQQRGLIVLKNELFEEMGDGDNLNLESINEIITKNDKIYAFSQRQMSIIKYMVKDALRRNQAVNHFYNKNFKNPDKIYQQFYNAEPNGKVELHKGPISLALICNDENDYARMYTNDRSGRRDLSDEEKTAANATAGFFSWSSPGGFSELRSTIIGVKRPKYSDIRETIEHEEQHAINKVYLNNIHLLMKDGLSSFLYLCADQEQAKDLVSSYCHYLIASYSNSAKDEIIAYKTGNRRDKDIIYTLTRNKNDGGLYDYFDFDAVIEQIQNIAEKNVSKSQQLELIDLAKKILKDEYKILIKKGLDAINILKNKNYSQVSITAILMPEALENWTKKAERTSFSDDLFRPQNELQNVAPSYEIDELQDLKYNLPQR